MSNKDRISIQVGLSGYSFQVEAGFSLRSSGWMSAESVFTTAELQRRYDDVEVSVFTPYCTLVPRQFFSENEAVSQLSDLMNLPEGAMVEWTPVPEFDAVMVYSNAIGGTLHKVVAESVLMVDGGKSKPLPEMFYMLKSLSDITEYNRIVASYVDGVLYLAVAQGKTLMLCNSFKAPDFTTALYHIFLVLNKLQLNLEMSTIYFRTPLQEHEELTLYRYFKSVEQI